MDEFINNLKLLLENFRGDNCTNSCHKCKLSKELIEVDGEWYVSYDICDLLQKIKENL